MRGKRRETCLRKIKERTFQIFVKKGRRKSFFLSRFVGKKSRNFYSQTERELPPSFPFLFIPNFPWQKEGKGVGLIAQAFGSCTFPPLFFPLPPLVSQGLQKKERGEGRGEGRDGNCFSYPGNERKALYIVSSFFSISPSFSFSLFRYVLLSSPPSSLFRLPVLLK